MTIHSDWSRLLHEECPEAFLQKPPKIRMEVGVIDGHLQLMALHKDLPSWDAFVQYLFVNPIKKLFSAGCPRVVMCFDCYDHVPSYKSMTQLKRVHRGPVAVFDSSHSLPARIPEDPMLFLMNRNFKIKVVEMVCAKLPGLIELEEGQELLIDYKTVVCYRYGGCNIPRLMEEFAPMGESDVKFCRYVTKYGNALVHAIDGDYLAIALLYYTMHELHLHNQIYIFRQLAVLPTTATRKKRKTTEEKPKKQKCWVDIQALFLTILQTMRRCVSSLPQSLGNGERQLTEADVVHAVVLFMLCAGTDFSRPLPWLGPKRLWDHLPSVAMQLILSVPAGGSMLQEELLLHAVIAKLYQRVFTKHVSPSAKTLPKVLVQLKHSKLAASVKAKMPSVPQVVTTIKNLRWVLQYWKTYNGKVPTPLDGYNGYLQDPTSRQITYNDLLQ